MKTFTKIILIIAGLLIIFGVGLGFFAVNRGAAVADLAVPGILTDQPVFGWLAGDKADADDYDLLFRRAGEQRITKLELYVGAGDVRIKSGEDFAILYNGWKSNLLAQRDHGVLSLSFNEHTRLRDWRGWRRISDNAVLTLVIPEDYRFDDIIVNMDAGRLTAASLDFRDSAVISLDAGMLFIDSVKGAKADFSVDAGVMELNNYQVEQADIHCDVGSVSIDTAYTASQLAGSIDADLGHVKIGSRSYNGTVHTVFGGAGAEAVLHMTCDLGTVRVRCAE